MRERHRSISHHRPIGISSFVVSVLAGIACAPQLIQPGLTPAPPSVTQSARTIIRTVVDGRKIPGFSVTVSRGNNLIWREGFGLSNLETGQAATPRTQFRVGSVSKLLTAAALMRLSESGRLDLDAPISTYLEVPEALRAVTLRQLAGHQGGIRHYRGDEFFSRAHYPRLNAALAVFSADPLIAAPGTQYAYSSYGYNLIGAAFEAKQELPFSEVIRREVLEPLGMRLTLVDDGGTMRSSRARGYEVGADGPSPVPRDDLSGRWPSGGFMMPTDDMTRLGRSILAPGFLSAASLSTMLTPQNLASGEATTVGIGWRVAIDASGRTYFHHGGSSNGGRAFLLVYPEAQLVVAMAANAFTDWGEKDALAIAQVFLKDAAGSTEAGVPLDMTKRP